jgi:hypothetical protein
MAYIGKQPVVGNFVKLDAITTSATATYNLLNGGVAYFPQTANNCIVSLNGVIQSPTSAYTISGSTIIFSDALTASDSIDFILVLGDVLSIGTPSDGTITSAKLASGTAGLISWQSVQTTGFTASAGRGYPCNTTSAAFTVTLPATPSAGDEVIILDYAGTFDTNILTISPNGNKIEGGTDNLALTGEREGVRLVYIDSTQGWLAYSGINEGTDALSPTPYSVEYLVVAGGGGGGNDVGGGGGAGGLLSNTFSLTPASSYTITIGAGGNGSVSNLAGSVGGNSEILGTGITTVTAIGGGGGGSWDGVSGTAGGSGGGGGAGASTAGTGGSGTSGQGNAGANGIVGGFGANNGIGGGGGGASASGSSQNGGNGSSAYSVWGSATTSGQNVSGTYYFAGGGSGTDDTGSTSGTAGLGGGGTYSSGQNGTANTGGGASGGGTAPTNSGGNGGSGIIILRYSGSQRGTGGTVVSSGGYTYHKFTSTSSYTA